MPARPDYFRFLHALQKDISTSFGDIGVVALEYCGFHQNPLYKRFETPLLALTPDSPFPTQLKQANAALSHFLNKGISPENIVIGGDSAGGNLVLQLASHLLHPLSSIPPPPALSQPLAGAMLISPWCAYDPNKPSYVRNDDKDVFPAVTYAHFPQFVTTGLSPELEPHCHPFIAPASWWKGLDGVFARALITAGENEGPFDHIIEIGTTISQNVKDTLTLVETGAVHEEMIFRFATGKDGVGKVYEDMVRFLSRSFMG